MTTRPGGAIGSRPLPFFWLVDCSGSMSLSGKMQAVNDSIRKVLPEMLAVASENPAVEVFTRVLQFSHGAAWCAPWASLKDFAFSDLNAAPLATGSAAADIVFLVDTSGSMANEIEVVKRKCVEFADCITRVGADVHLGLVGFDIGGHAGESHGHYSVHSLSEYTLGTWPLSPPSQFQTMVRELFIGQFGGAGCYLADESTVEIFPVVSALFRNTTRSARKFLVVISDELGKSSGLSRIVSELKKNEITAYVLGVPGKQDAHEQLALQTGGEFWNILRTKGNQDFKQLLSNVADSVGREMKKQLEDGTVSSGTDLGAALGLLAVELHVEKMASRALPPIVVLLSDGRPTDDFRAALRNLEKQSWWKRSIRMAIAIGSDSVPEALREFIGTDQIPLLNASNPESLLRYIRWASTTVLRSMSCPSSVTSPNEQKPRVVIPEVPRFLAERFVDNNIW